MVIKNKPLKYNHLPTIKYDKYTYDNLDRLTAVDYGETSGWSQYQPLYDLPIFRELNQLNGLERMLAMSESWLSDSPFLTVGVRQETAWDRIPPYDVLMVLAQQWLNDDMDGLPAKPTANQPRLSWQLQPVFEQVFDAAMTPQAKKALMDQLFEDRPMISATVVKTNSDGTTTKLDLIDGYYHETTYDGSGRMMGWKVYERINRRKRKALVEITFDAQERIDWLRLYGTDKSWSDVAISYNLDGTISEQLVKEYDNKGNLTGMSLYQPQPVMGMQQASGGGGNPPMTEPGFPLDRVETTTYDDLGNRVSVVADHGFGIITTDTYTTNDFNQYTQIDRGDPNAIAYLNYDVAGNTTEDSQGYFHYYDEENRIYQIADPNNDTLVEFSYDALGRRIKKYDVAQDLTTLFYYDTNWRVISEYEQTGTGTNSAKPCRFFVYGNGIDEILAMFTPGSPPSGDPNDLVDLEAFVTTWLLGPNDNDYDDTYDDPNDNFIDYLDFATLNNGWTYTPKIPEQRWYYMKDALGSVMGLMGSHPNAKSEFYLYDVYGKPNATSDVGNPYMFTSRRVDVLDGGNLVSQHSRRRDLDYYLGRFKTHDPVGYVDGLNLYEYVRSNPVRYVDPYGLSCSLLQYSGASNFSGVRGPFKCPQYPLSGTAPKVYSIYDAAYHFLFGDGSDRELSFGIINGFTKTSPGYSIALQEIKREADRKAKEKAQCQNCVNFGFGDGNVTSNWTPTTGKFTFQGIINALGVGGVLGAGVDTLVWNVSCGVRCGLKGQAANCGCKCKTACTVTFHLQDTFNVKAKLSAGPYIALKPFGTPFDMFACWQIEIYRPKFIYSDK